MAERPKTIQELTGAVVAAWEPLAAGDTGSAFGPSADTAVISCVQMTGTFGGTVTLEGSNDGSNWAPLKNMQGDDIAMTGAGLVDFTTAARFIRPNAGTGVTSVTVTLVARG